MNRIPREVIRELIQSEEFNSTGDIMEAIKAMFADVLGEVLKAELDNPSDFFYFCNMKKGIQLRLSPPESLCLRFGQLSVKIAGIFM